MRPRNLLYAGVVIALGCSVSQAALGSEKQRACAKALGFLPAMQYIGPDLKESLDAAQPGEFKEIMDEFKRLSGEGNVEARWSLGFLYEHGRCVEQDGRAAVDWYTRAARGGYVDAMENLGVMYLTGRAVEQNDTRAYMWFEIAAREGRDRAELNKQRLAARMSSRQITAAQGRATAWINENLN